MPVRRSSFRAHFALAGQGWKKQVRGQTMTLCRILIKLTMVLASFSASRLPGFDPRVKDCCLMETLRDMIHNQSQLTESCMACGTHSP